MKKTLFCILLPCLLAGSNTLHGQEPHHARISVIHPGVNSLIADLKSMVDLTSTEDQETWVDLKDYIDLFSIGVEGERPIRVDLLAGITPVCYQIWVPLAGEPGPALADDFRDNFDANGFPTRRDPQDRTLYEIDAEPDYGWFRVLNDSRYGIILITSDKSDLPLLRQIILKSDEPSAEVAILTGLQSSLAGELVNAAITPEDQEKRRSANAELRKTSMDALQQRPEETSTEFAMRQKALENQLDELERLVAESAAIRAWAVYDRDTHRASLNFSATAIEGTSLEATIAEFGTRPDVFAAIPVVEGSALSGRLNHPIDAMRQANALEFIDLFNVDMEARIAASTELNDEQKSASVELLHGILEITRDTIGTGNANGFIESRPASGTEFSTMMGLAVPNAARVNALIPIFGRSRDGNQTDVDLEKVGDFTIHRVRLAAGFIDLVDRVFGKERDLFIAVSDSQVWFASGENSLDLLKSTLATPGEPAMHNKSIHVDARLLKWAERLKKIVDETPEPELTTEKEAWRERRRLVERAVDALRTHDELVVDVTTEDNQVNGMITVNEGTIRFVGKMIAAFTRDNLK